MPEPEKRIIPRGKSYPKETRELALSLYLQGVSREMIVRQTGVSMPTIGKWIARGRWVNARDTSLDVLQQTGRKSAILAVNTDLIHRSNLIRNTLAEEVEHQTQVLRSEPARKAGELAGRNGRAAVLKTIVEAASTVFDWADSGTKGLVIMGDMEAVERSLNAAQDAPAIDVDSSASPDSQAT